MGQVRSRAQRHRRRRGQRVLQDDLPLRQCQRALADQINANTLTLMAGSLGSTSANMGADLASVLDNGIDLRILPVMGRGSVQAVADILLLRGVDAGIVRKDTLAYLERKDYANNIRNQFVYITKMFNEEMHVLAPQSIGSMKELDGKTVAVDLPDSSTFVTSINVFERLGIKPHLLYIEPRIALDMLRKATSTRSSRWTASRCSGSPRSTTPTCISCRSTTTSRCATTICRRSSLGGLPQPGVGRQYRGHHRGEAVLAAYNWQPGNDAIAASRCWSSRCSPAWRNCSGHRSIRMAGTCTNWAPPVPAGPGSRWRRIGSTATHLSRPWRRVPRRPRSGRGERPAGRGSGALPRIPEWRANRAKPQERR